LESKRAALAIAAITAITAITAFGVSHAAEPAQSRDDDVRSKDKPVIIQSKPWLFNRETRYSHTVPEVNGQTITVTKKISLVELADQPTIIDNNVREIFDRLPGLVLAEQQNPTQLNLSYRGLGNPQESEYVLLMQDGIPLELDWIGYPTAYYLPVPQTIKSVQMIRGGSGLLYGPEPQPVINFISVAPTFDRALSGTTEQVGGSDSLFSSFNRLSGTVGDWDYLADYSHRQSTGQRLNGDYHVNTGDLRVGYRFGANQKLTFTFNAYSVQSGLAGLMTAAQFHATPDLTTTPADRLWTDRYTAAITYDNTFDEFNSFTQKVWSGYQDLITRADTYSLVLAPLTAALSEQRFHYTGLDGRFLHRWGHGNALTVGYTAYTSRSPYNQYSNTNPHVDRDGDPGRRTYGNERKTNYAAVFAENVFRFRYLHLVTSARFDHEELKADETVATHANLIDTTYRKNIPLFGIGIGNDFGHGNETYLNIAQGFRPLRYLDIASPFTNYNNGNNPDPTHYVTYEAGVHGWPKRGLYYDASVFQVNVHDRIEARTSEIPGQTVDVNTGDTRSRGVELEGWYDVLRLWPDAPDHRHIDVFANATYLNARFTNSINPTQIGKTPAYAPDYVFKTGITFRQDKLYKASLIVDSVASQFFQDSNQPVLQGTTSIIATQARIPGYTVLDFSGEYTIAEHFRVLGGISNLTDRKYYSRVFISRGLVEPARDRMFNLGVAYDL
jgi:Fe(3+) dicitrate transport protein